MSRVLALQGLTGSLPGSIVFGDSNQSNACSASTSDCSTQSAGCRKPIVYAIAW